MYKYKKAINLIINNFEEIKKIYENDKDYYIDLPYLFYESVFLPYIINCFNNSNFNMLVKIFDLIEDIMKNGDEELVNLIEVSIVESIYFDDKIENKEKLIKFFKRLTRESYDKCF